MTPPPPPPKPLSNNTKSKHQSRKGLEILPWRRREEEERKERHLIKDLEVRNRRHARAEVPGVTTRVSSHLLSSSDASSASLRPPSTLVMPVHWHHKEWILAPLKTGVTHVFSTMLTDEGKKNCQELPKHPRSEGTAARNHALRPRTVRSRST